MFTTEPRIETLPLSGHCRYIVDNALADPEALVALAAEHRSLFRTWPHNMYPGVEIGAPADLAAALGEFFMLHLRALLHGQRTLHQHSRLSMATLQPDALQPAQWFAHRDNQQVPAGQCIAASVLYLFSNPALGGTSFFRPRRDTLETAQLIHDTGTLDTAAFVARHGGAVARGFQTTSNGYFELVQRVPAKWNRLICYDGSLFHCSDIRAPELLNDDPARGRLTLNGFFTCSRRQA